MNKEIKKTPIVDIFNIIQKVQDACAGIHLKEDEEQCKATKRSKGHADEKRTHQPYLSKYCTQMP